MRLLFLGFVIMASYISFAFCFTATSPFLNEIAQKLNLHSLLALSPVTTVITATKIVTPFFAIYIIRYLGVHWSFVLSIFFISLSILSPFATTYGDFLLSRFFLGFGGSLFAIYVHPIIAYYFKNKTQVFLNGSIPISFHIGSTLAFNFATTIALYFGHWEYPLIAGSALAILSFFITIILFYPHIRSKFQEKALSKPNINFSFIKGLKDPFAILVALTGSGAVGSFIIFISFYLKIGIPHVETSINAGFIAGIVGLITAPFIRPKNYLTILQIAGIAQIIGFSGMSFIKDPSISWFFAVLAGGALSFPAPILFSYIHKQKKDSSENLTNTMGVFWMITYIITTAGTTLFAYLVDLEKGNLFIPLIFNICIASLYLIGSTILKQKYQLTPQAG